MTPRRVLLVVEDDPDIAFLLKIKFNPQPDFAVEGEATNAADAIGLAQALSPDLILLDNGLDGPMTGLAASPLLKEAAPGCRIILYSASEEIREEAMGNSSIDAFVLKTEVPNLVDRAREVLGDD